VAKVGGTVKVARQKSRAYRIAVVLLWQKKTIYSLVGVVGLDQVLGNGGALEAKVVGLCEGWG